jgi:hypothetical protein
VYMLASSDQNVHDFKLSLELLLLEDEHVSECFLIDGLSPSRGE